MAQIQFKVGDKVRLVSIYPDGYTEPFDNGELKIGNIYTIDLVNVNWPYPYALEGTEYLVSADMIELI